VVIFYIARHTSSGCGLLLPVTGDNPGAPALFPAKLHK